MMKTTIGLLLFGFACVLASPSCTQEEFEKCGRNEGPEDHDGFESMETEESLELLCSTDAKVVNCQLDMMERCPDSGFGHKKIIEDVKRKYDILCDKINPIRKKYINNSECLKEFMNGVRSTCNNGEKLDFETDQEACNKLKKMLECAEKGVADKCGEEAKEAFLGIENPDYQLRAAKCVV